MIALASAAPASWAAAAPCSDEWYASIEKEVQAGDAQGHGPDRGSDEWKSTIEFKLGVRGEAGVPPRDSTQWCRYVDQRVAQRRSSTPAAANGKGPAFSCAKVRPGSIEALICSDEALSALDRKLAVVYAAAIRNAVNEHPPTLKAEQRGWIKGRDECWKSDDENSCVQSEYTHRIAELRARYRLIAGRGPVRYTCDGNPANELVVTFFKTDPPTLIAERADSVSLMYLAPSGSGAKYQGRNETFWGHQDEARVTWGYGAKEMICRKS